MLLKTKKFRALVGFLELREDGGGQSSHVRPQHLRNGVANASAVDMTAPDQFAQTSK